MNLTLQFPNRAYGHVLTAEPTEYLDEVLLDPDTRRLRALFTATQLAAVPVNHLRLWCFRHARYVLPTRELVTWLRARIGGRNAIEIASGNGDLGWLLGIRETDSFVQQEAEHAYHWQGQPRTRPPATVEKLDALAAVRKYDPQVVVGAWFTRKFELERGDIPGRAQASMFGEREERIFDHKSVETYIHVGNLRSHGEKTLLKKRHEAIRLAGHLSRVADEPGTNVIYVWDKRKP